VRTEKQKNKRPTPNDIADTAKNFPQKISYFISNTLWQCVCLHLCLSFKTES